MLIVHLLQAEINNAAHSEHIVAHMTTHMKWTPEYTSEVIAQCICEELIDLYGNKSTLTPYGREKANLSLITN
jgi:hypothetical protein